MTDCKLPRVSTILREMVLLDEKPDWLKPRYLRRGRLVDAMANVIAMGGTIDPEWLQGHSGEDANDRVEHSEVIPYIEGLQKALRELQFKVIRCSLPTVPFEIINEALGYICHPDWIISYLITPDVEELWDLKTGLPPPKWIHDGVEVDGVIPWRINPLWVYYRYQTAAYVLAYAQQKGISPYRIRRANLHLFDSTYRLVPHDDRGDFANFSILAQAYRLRS